MGENTKVKERQYTADALREQIRHTESDITKTVHTIEQRLSPSQVRLRVVRDAKRVTWQGTAKLLGLAQRTSVQASLIGGSVLLPLLLMTRNREGHSRAAAKKAARKPVAAALPRAGTAAKEAGATGLTGLRLLLSRKGKDREEMPTKTSSVSTAVLAATAAKAFLSGARSSKKSRTTLPGRKAAWRGLATAIGAALGSYWYSHKERRV